MKVSTAKAEVLDKGLAIDHDQFEQRGRNILALARRQPSSALHFHPAHGTIKSNE
jgi:hypothetical protein